MSVDESEFEAKLGLSKAYTQHLFAFLIYNKISQYNQISSNTISNWENLLYYKAILLPIRKLYYESHHIRKKFTTS